MRVNPAGAAPLHSVHRNMVAFAFSFDTNNVSAPDGLVDPGGVVASSGLSWLATGRLQVELEDQYTAIVCHCDMEDTAAGTRVRLESTTLGATVTNYINLLTIAGPIAADSTDKKIHVSGYFLRSTT
uniref:Uncharacterized protein n=1 Tax=viral metagenome TaxID=1070528 RepID=A0A6M3XHN2_9ZZZZ